MPWKTNDSGELELSGGNPVWIYSDGSESPMDDVDALVNQANAAKQAETKLKQEIGQYKKFGKPDEVAKAIETAKRAEQGELIGQEKLDEVREQVRQELQAQIQERDTRLGELGQRLDNWVRLDALQSSQFLKEKTILPADVALRMEQLGGQLRVEEKDGKVQVVPYEGDSPMLSRKKAGEYASVDEALERYWQAVPDRERFEVKPQPGSGAQGGTGGQHDSAPQSVEDWVKQSLGVS